MNISSTISSKSMLIDINILVESKRIWDISYYTTLWISETMIL